MKDIPIIGIMGPANSGKDLVADWFVKKGFVKIAFSDPIKRFVSDVFGFSSELMWGDSELRDKEFEVDGEWWLNAADRIKPSSDEIFNEVLEPGMKITGFLEMYTCLSNLRASCKDRISARVILQTFGTEWGRKIDPLIWVKYAYKCIGAMGPRCGYTQEGGISYLSCMEENIDIKGVVITDHRFLNEIEYTRSQPNAYVIRINRPGKKEGNVGIPQHISEHGQKDIPNDKVDLVLDLPEGKDNVYKVLEEVYESKAWMQRNRS